MTEGYATLEYMIKYYGSIEDGRIVRYGAQVPFNFLLITYTNMGTKTYEYKNHIESWMKSMPKGKGIEANWLVSFQLLKKCPGLGDTSILISFFTTLAWKPR